MGLLFVQVFFNSSTLPVSILDFYSTPKGFFNIALATIGTHSSAIPKKMVVKTVPWSVSHEWPRCDLFRANSVGTPPLVT